MVTAKQRNEGSAIDYRLLLDSMLDAEVIMLDAGGRILSWNKGGELLKGYSADEVIGQPVTLFYTDADQQSGLAAKELLAAATHGRFAVDGWRVGKGGKRFWASVVLQPVRDAAGALTGYVKVTRDMTASRRQEQDRASLMLESMTDYEVILLDKEGNIRSWNRGAELLKGYKAEEVIGRHVSVFHTQQDLESDLASRELETTLRTGRFEFEGWRVKKGGAKFWANVVLTRVTDGDGNHTGFVKVARDLTERVERERLVEKQRDEILELSTPVIQVWDKILALPIIGTLDSHRAARLTDSLLQRIASDEAEFVILDISGVPTIDTQVAEHLLKTVHGARLMGAESIISGVRPETAQAMVNLGIEIGSLRSRATLRDALQLALRLRRETAERQVSLQ